MDFNRSSNNTQNITNINNKQLSAAAASSSIDASNNKSASEHQQSASTTTAATSSALRKNSIKKNGVNSNNNYNNSNSLSISSDQLNNTATETSSSTSSTCSGGGAAAVDDPETIKLSSSSGGETSCNSDNNSKLNSELNKKISTPPLSYNEFVNQIYDIPPSVQVSASSAGVNTAISIPDEANEEIKPLLPSKINYQSEKLRRPKSIVKSPSSQSFSVTAAAGVDQSVNQPRFSLQEGQMNGDRPVLRVQFSQNDLDETSKLPDCSSPVGSIRSGSSSQSNTSSSSDDDENSSIGYSEARPPDGGWGWVVVFASFMVNLIADGVTFSFGVIYIEFLKYFDEGKAMTSLIGSLFMAIPLLSGPIASFLTDRYGCRKVTIVGSILASAGFIMSSFVNSTGMLCLTFGIFAGFGLSLCYVAAVVIVAYYFEKRRSFATGLSVCGSGIGTFIFAPLTQYLVEAYGWRGTLLIIGGIFLNMTVCGLLMRDLEWTTHRAKEKAKKKKGNKMRISAESFSVSNSTNTGGTTNGTSGMGDDDVFEPRRHPDLDHFDIDDPHAFSSLINLPTFIKNGEKVPPEVLESLATNKNVRNIILQNYPGLLHSRSFSEPFTSRNGSVPDTSLTPQNPDALSPTTNHLFRSNTHPHHQNNHPHSGGNHIRPNNSAYFKDLRMHRHSLTYRGAMLNINRYRLRASSCPDIYRNSMTTIAKEKSQWYQGVAEFKNLFIDILDFSYFTDIRFVLFTISNFLLYCWYDVPYVYLADNATEMGFSDKQASGLISIIGIVNMVGEILLGWFGDKKWMSANLVYALSMACCGVVIGLVPLFKTYEALSILSGLFGLFIAANYSLTSVILVELITLERFTNAYGLLLLMQGIANLIGPPLAGWIYDITGTYDLSFYLAGVFIVLSGLMLLILPILGRYKKYKSLRRQDSEGKIKNNDVNYAEATQNGKANGTAILNDCFAKELLKDGIKANHV